MLSLAAALILTAVPAYADTSAQKMAEAAQVKSQVEALDNRVPQLLVEGRGFCPD